MILTYQPNYRRDQGQSDERQRKQPVAKMKRKPYEKELRKLQVELCHLQRWVTTKGLRVIVIFEGRDAAGKGGTIKALTEKVSPRVFRTAPPRAIRPGKNPDVSPALH